MSERQPLAARPDDLGPQGPASGDAFVALCDWYETLTPASLTQIGTYYAAGVRFKDPFNDVSGLEAVRRVFLHMFETLESPRFRISHRVRQGGQAFAVWQFEFRSGGKALCIQGSTHFELDGQGKVTLHRDYWDAAEELYEHFPLLGGLLRLIKRKLAATP